MSFVNREELINEERLRNYIRDSIKTVKDHRRASLLESRINERKLRGYIRKLIIEANEAAPHSSTGINVLEDLLKKIIPQIETEYKKLTTSVDQRSSFRAHIVNAVQNALAPTKASQQAGSSLGVGDFADDEEEYDKAIDIGRSYGGAGAMEESLEEADIELDVDGEEESASIADAEAEEFIDIDGEPGNVQKDEEPDEKDTFGVQGEDETGRNMAFKAFQRVEQSIVDAYDILSNDEDRELFYDYLLTNLKLYFDKFEDELTSVLPEPTTSEYEDEKDNQDSEEEVADDEEGGLDDLGDSEGEEDLGDEDELGSDDELEL